MICPKPDVTVTTEVATDPETAFAIFTEEIDTWWRRGPRHRFSRDKTGVLRFEPGVGGRLIEIYDDGETWEVGRVSAWDPGARLVFEWRLRNFAEGEVTEVEIRFQASARGTRVTVEHRGLSLLPTSHPARHGLEGEALTSMFGLWWGDVVVGLRAHVKASRVSS